MLDIKLERDLVFQAQTGSYNYNLNTEGSDRDYKIFVYPTFEDVYHKDQYFTSLVSKDLDYTVHDLRKLPSLLKKSNLSFIEVLFSREIIKIDVDLSIFFDNREEIAAINPRAMFHLCMNASQEKYNKLEKGTASTQALVDKFGYDTKQALHCYRYADFLQRYLDKGNFEQALRYEGKDKDFMLSIRNGAYTLEEFKAMADEKQLQVEPLGLEYMSRNGNEKLYLELEEHIYQLIKAHLL